MRIESKEIVPEIFFGIRISNVTNKILEDIVQIYLKTGGGYPGEWKSLTTQDLVEGLSLEQEGIYVGSFSCRFGSRFSGHSKLRIERALVEEDDVIKFGAYYNEDLGGKWKRQAEKWEDQFKKQASDYLKKSGLGIPLSEII